MEILFYICFAAVLLILGGMIAIFLTTSEEEKKAAGYNRNPQPWFIGHVFQPGDRLYSVRFMKIDGEFRRFDEFIVTEVVGQCVVGFEIPSGRSPQKRSFNVNRLISCVR